MPLSHLTLVVPDLLWADPDLRREATRELPLPALGWLLGRGQARAGAKRLGLPGRAVCRTG